MMPRLSDPSLPGLAVALDAERMRERLGRALARPDEPSHSSGPGRRPTSRRPPINVERVAILDVQYRPGESCIVLYKVKLRDTESGRGWGATLAGWIHPPGTQVPRPGADQIARYAAVAEPSLGDPVIRLTDPAMIVFVSPLDPRLPRLVDASDPSEMKVRLGRLWSARDARVLRVRIHPMSHTPGARAAVGYEVLGESRTTGLPELRHLVGKIDTGKQAASVFSRSWVVWRASHTRIPIAPPIG